MRGGAIPLLCWATLLVVLMAINWLWTGDAIQVGTFGFAALVIYVSGLLLWLARRDALRRGPPETTTEVEPEPAASVAAALVGLAVGCMLFGVVWSTFLIWFGAGMLVLALGRLTVELRAQRETVEGVRRRPQR